MEKSEITKRPVAPCLKCEDRREKCHSVCDRYKAYQETNKAWHEAIKNNRKQSGQWVIDFKGGVDD